MHFYIITKCSRGHFGSSCKHLVYLTHPPLSRRAKLGGNAFICLALLRAADVDSTVANSFRTDPTVTL